MEPSFETRKRGTWTVVEVRGELDLSTSDELRSALDGAFDTEPPRVAVDLTGVDDWNGMLDRTEAVLSEAERAAGGAHLVTRLSISGATPLAWRLRRDEDLLLAEVQNLAASLGACWIEAVELAVSAPLAESTDAGPITELARLMHEDVIETHAYREEVRETLADVLRQLPKEARSLLAGDEAAEEALLSALAREGADAVLARLGGEGERA